MNRRTLLKCLGGAAVALLAEPAQAASSADDALLEDLEHRAFRFFWEQADAKTGQVKDRAHASGRDDYFAASIAATGFGLTALCIADERRWAPSSAIHDRVLATLQYAAHDLPQEHGFYYHFLDMHNGERLWNCELSPIDTTLFLCGVLTCRQHFAADSDIVNLATLIYNRVDWVWMLNGGKTLCMEWTPERGFNKSRWDTFCELMMMYLLGIGSPSHPMPVDSWNAFSRPRVKYDGLDYISGAPTLFTHQYSQAWFDFRNRRDAYADYFQNSTTATLAHMQFCLSLHDRFSDYTKDLWGFSASDSAHGYVAWGGPPAEGPIDGTIVPCAAGGSIPFLPAETLRVLHTVRQVYGDTAWGRYGPIDAFNPLTGWTNADVLGIDLGITMIMAENYRTGFVWKTFMANVEMVQAMRKVGFRDTKA